MNEQFIKNIRVLKKAISDRKLVVFAGAGISIDSGVPSWEKLIDELRHEINIPERETDFLRIAQLYYNERQQKELIDKIRETLKYKKLRYNEIHEAVFELNPEHIITTNFDDLLEQVIKAKAYPFSVIKKDSEFPYGRNTKLLVKIHGDLEEGNLVIKEDDYLEYSSNHPLIESFIKGVFANKVVLFIGYSFSDINLKIILQSVRNILGHDFQNAYMLTNEENFHPAKRQYLKNKGINVINYDDAGMLFNMNSIEQYLFMGRNALHHEFAKRSTSLSTSGSKLLYLIKFITKYIDFAESIIKNDPLTQIYKSLNRFNEVRVLPPTFLGNLFPFNMRKKYIYNYSDETLGSNNEKITNFFFNEINRETNTLNDNYFLNHSISLNKKDELNKNLYEVLQKMNLSSIFFFGRSNHKLELFDYPKELSEKVNISLPEKHCECLSCLFNRFRIKDFLKKLKEESITETSEIQNDLLFAYSNYKAANFKTAYIQFEEIANKAWQLGKYISYYIAKQNIKYLRNMISWADYDISTETKKDIVEKIDDLDLDKLIFQIPNLDDDEYRLLKFIRDDELLVEIENDISKYYEKIVDVYDLYKRRGFSTGPYYPYLIQESLCRLFFFYTYNYIVKDEYSNFRRIIEKGIKALLICYAIEERYPERLRSFDFWTLKFIMLYGDADDILKTIDKFKINKIDVEEEDLPKTIQNLNNLFESIFNESNVWGRTVIKDKNVSSQTESFYFQDRIRNVIHSSLLLFGFIKIPEENSKILIRNFLDFLKAESILVWHSEKFLNSFFNNLKDYFSFEDFIELLKLITEREVKYVDDTFFRIVGFGINNRYPEKVIEDEDLIKVIIAQSINSKKHHHERGFLYLWKVCSGTNKEIIRRALETDLTATFNCIAYLNACHESIFPPAAFFSNYIRELERHIPKEIKWQNGLPHHDDFTFYNFVTMIYAKNLLDEEIPYTRFDDYPDFWKFYLRPMSFDYSKFNAKWLLVVNRKSVHEKFKEIPQIKGAIKEKLKIEFDEHLSKLYSQFYLD